MNEYYYKKVFAKNLKYYMELNSKTQIDIINDLGFNKSAVSTWCNGTRLPRMDKVDMLAKYFNISRSDLLEDKAEIEASNNLMANLEICKIVAANIVKYLSLNGKSQVDLADYMNVSQATVSNWCKGLKMPRMDKIDKLCAFFHCNRSDLIENKDNETDSEQFFTNKDAEKYVHFLFKNPEYKALFDASMKIKKEDLEVVKTLLDKFTDK